MQKGCLAALCDHSEVIHLSIEICCKADIAQMLVISFRINLHIYVFLKSIFSGREVALSMPVHSIYGASEAFPFIIHDAFLWVCETVIAAAQALKLHLSCLI